MDTELKNSWARVLSDLFPGGLPTQATWSNPSDIANTLNAIGAPNTGHMFFPDSGGQDVAGAAIRADDLVEIYASDSKSHAYLVRADSLEFHSQSANPLGAYFILSLSPISEAPEFPQSSGNFLEEYGEHKGKKYTFRELMNGYDKNENPLPDATRRIMRYWNGGKIAIFSKASPYNDQTVTNKAFGFDAYDAYHMDESKFKQVAEAIAKALE